MFEIDNNSFTQLVEDAIDSLPERFARLLDNIVVTVEEEPSDEDFASVDLDPEHDDLLGLYEGIPLGERGSEYSHLPDRVVLFRLPILWISESREDVLQEVRDTLIHELGHHFGLSDEEMPY